MSVSQPSTLINMTTQSSSPFLGKQPVNQQTPLLSDQYGVPFAVEYRGKYAAATKAGVLFVGNTVIAGVALPVNAATLASKFTLWNPLGSGVDIELVEFALGLDSATEVVNGLAVGLQTSVSTTGGSPGTLTQLTTPWNTYGNAAAGAPKGKLYSAATLTNAAVLTSLMGLGMSFDATSGAMSGDGKYNFDGKIILPPDTIATFLSTVAAITAAFCSLSWMELPA